MEEIACAHCSPKCLIYHLTRAELVELGCSRLISYPKQSMVFAQGEDLRGSFLICRGSVALFELDPEGNCLLLAIAGPGDLIGVEDLLAEQEQYSIYAQAMEDLKPRFLPSGSFHSALQRNSNLSYRLSTTLSEQVVRLRSRLLVTAYGDIRQRLIEVLVSCLRDNHHCPSSGGEGVNPRLNTEILSQMVGCSTRSLHPELKRLLRQGIIVREGYRILISDSARLTLLMQTCNVRHASEKMQEKIPELFRKEFLDRSVLAV
ncbi:Crp/Fnr family transcriptional regulator [Dehalococcoidia bacterium]|nr:Crp/Fnr family transcriptional regulator [Dehalococcoidia bacterium]